MKKTLLSIALLTSAVFAQNSLVMPYGGYIDYSNKSVKDYGYVGGVYLSQGYKNLKFELDLEHTYIKYKNNYPSYNQNDITAVVNGYFQGNYTFKAGLHNMYVNQAGNNQTQHVYFAGVGYYEYLKYNAGIDAYYSKYDGFNVHQYSPYVGYNFGDYYSQMGSFYLKVQPNIIRISDDKAAPKKNYTDVDVSLSNYIKNWTTTLKASFGKSAYKVANGGFIVYNLGEEYKGTYGVDVKYAIDKQSAVNVGVTYSTFNEDSNDASNVVYLISYSRAF